jgi:hypothetical protein
MTVPHTSTLLVAQCLLLAEIGCSATGVPNSGGPAETAGVAGSSSGTGSSASSTAASSATSISSATTSRSAGSGDCTFEVTSRSISPQMATVGVVQWSTTLSELTSAQIVYSLDNATSGILNRGGTAPVDLSLANYRTLLLGLKQSSTYTFHIEATSSSGATCTSADYSMSTGTLSGARTVTRTVANSSALAAGFIVTCSGQGIVSGKAGSSSAAYVIDADGATVWYASAPSECSRARMDYEGANMWMLALNVNNNGGEMRYLSMDGQTNQTNVGGLSGAHHDFTVLPGGIVAAMVWASTGTDPESNLIERYSDGSQKTVFKIGSNLYVGGQSSMGSARSNGYHSNSILYHPLDDSYTIGDRDPNLYVKVTRTGSPLWQIGGSCTNAPASRCAAGTWKVNHGHDFDAKTGNLLIFNNGQSGSAHVLEFKISDSDSFGISAVKDYTSGNSSQSLGDVQRLPNGNTLITYSNGGAILEVDPSWNLVQTLKGSFGYAEWRETLYGPPAR